MTNTESKTITFNGKAVPLPAALSLEEVLRSQGVEPSAKGVAVAVDWTVVRQPEWATTQVVGGESIEVVTATQGG